MIVAVTAGKGGVGKSTVALNLAAALDAVAVDADLSMADLPAGRGPDLHDVLAGRADPIEAVHEGGPVALLPCGRSLAGARATDPEALADTLSRVDRRYGGVVVDCPAGLRSDAGLPLLAADCCVVVTRPTAAALADALRVREFARTVETPLVRVVLNRFVSGDTDRIADTLGAPVLTLPESDALARAQRTGHPVAARHPESPAAETFERLADAVHSVRS
jgi:septum site-determining protein MinD